jgi:DNA polymerase
VIIECHGDYETRSHVHPGDVGTYSYVWHPTTEVLFFWYRIAGDYKCWRIWEKQPIPADLLAALQNPDCHFVFFNSAFERYVFARLGYTIPPSRIIDPQVYGRYLSLPASLGVQCQVLGVPLKLAKKGGKDYIKLFCEPVVVKPTKKNGLTEPKVYYNDWNSHPLEWEEFLEYGKYDVISEGELLRRQRLLLGDELLPPSEKKLWLFDQKVNDRGMPVDVDFVTKMYKLAIRAKAEAKAEFEVMTGVKNANSPAQIKAWAKPQGYPFDSLKKDTVTSALKDPELQITDLCRAALKLRAEAASRSYQKLGKILEMVSPDGRLRGQFIFMGSARCGRWAGNAVQLHNMARPAVVGGFDFEDQKVVIDARRMVNAEDYDGIKTKYGSVLLVVKSLIRTVFVADIRWS